MTKDHLRQNVQRVIIEYRLRNTSVAQSSSSFYILYDYREKMLEGSANATDWVRIGFCYG
jgi:hypothetical protein